MEKEVSGKPYVVSRKFNESRENIYEYTVYSFGYYQAECYKQKYGSLWIRYPTSLWLIPNAATLRPKAGCTATLYSTHI